MSRKTRKQNSQPITDTVILEFLNAQSEKTRRTYASSFQQVLEFSKGESGQSMLENVSTWSRRIMTFREFLVSKDYSLTTIEGFTGMLRGFFAYYRKPLDLSRADKIKLGRTARNSEDYTFVQDDVKKMATIASLDEKYVLLAGISFGLRAEDFSSLTFGKYRLALESAQKENLTAPIPLGKVNTEKEEVYAYPLISSDALPIIQAILDSHKDAKDEDRVFTSKSTQLTAMLQTLAFNAGIDAHGQSVRFHCLRKYLFDRIVSVSSDTKAAQIIGHKVSGEKVPYIGQGSLREVYERAQASICITNGNGIVKAKVSELEIKAKNLEEENAQLKAKIADLEGKNVENEQNFTKMIGDLSTRLKTLEEIERKKPEKIKTWE